MKYTVVLMVVLWQLTACHKNELLKEKQATGIIVPTTPGDMQAILDNEDVFGPTTSLNFICADEFYLTPDAFSYLKQSAVSAYLHKDYLFDAEEEVPDWNIGYTQVYYANNVLEGVQRLRGNTDDKILDPLEGDAYFKRSYAFYNIAQVFVLPYDSLTAKDELGDPLRLTTRKDENLVRSSIAATYNKIIDDLLTAVPLLPPTIETLHRNRSSRPAAYALLARVYLSMGAYEQALDAAKRSLQGYDSLINFNTPAMLTSAANAETLYQSTVSNSDALYDAMDRKMVFVDSALLTEYKVNDLRRSVFFKSTPAIFKPVYYGKTTPFTGLGTAELYLIVAECYARQGNVNTALLYLNKLLKSRWKTGLYIPYTAVTPKIALDAILLERRKELIFRGLRWTDVRRLNIKDTLLTLSRTVQGNTYVLSPNSRRYALPIPEQVRRFNKQIVQNKY